MPVEQADRSARDPAARFAVVTRLALVIGGWAVAPVVIWAFLTDRTALGVSLMVAVFVLAAVRASWTVVRGRRKIAALREEAEVPEVVAAAGSPSPVDRVVADLLSMNSEGLPYVIEANRTADHVQVEVRWKSEEMRWKMLFVRGKVAYAWRMELTLDPTTSHYKFVEYSGTSQTSASLNPGGPFVHKNWTWKKGKTAMQMNASFAEGADGEVVVATPTGPRTSWEGAVSIRPSDAKKPVFTVLRNHGWRPRFDWFGARLFEK
ncbi:hypothetical protein [Isoptericola croceus]|uniref:hypothetical protein n=1 Tax=Isoptericola croceus TaxID=3031406 RepID=UPI0023F673D8|nr:hypothetical protein [Isoptericola croceus]